MNSYHIHLNHLDPHAHGIEISPEYPYSKRPINRFLRNARLLPSDSNLWHSLFPAATPTNNRATSTKKNSFQRHPRIPSSCPHLPQDNGNQLRCPCSSFHFHYFLPRFLWPLRVHTVGNFSSFSTLLILQT
jgi:hypothetical protein